MVEERGDQRDGNDSQSQRSGRSSRVRRRPQSSSSSIRRVFHPRGILTATVERMVPNAAQHTGGEFHQAVGIVKQETLPVPRKEANTVLINELICATETPSTAGPSVSECDGLLRPANPARIVAASPMRLRLGGRPVAGLHLVALPSQVP